MKISELNLKLTPKTEQFRIIQKFKAYCLKNQIEDFSEKLVLDYLENQKQENPNLKPPTLSKTRSLLLGYYKKHIYLALDGLDAKKQYDAFSEKTIFLTTHLCQRSQGRQLSPSELVYREDIVKLLLRDSKTDKKFFGLFSLFLFKTGLRISEALKIKISDCRENENSIYIKITETKTRKDRQIIVSKGLFNRCKICFESNEKLFQENITINTIQKYLRKHSERITGKDIYPHLIRHSFITALVKKGFNLKQVAKFCGNSEKVILDSYFHDKIDFDKFEKELVSKKNNPKSPEPPTPTPLIPIIQIETENCQTQKEEQSQIISTTPQPTLNLEYQAILEAIKTNQEAILNQKKMLTKLKTEDFQMNQRKITNSETRFSLVTESINKDNRLNKSERIILTHMLAKPIEFWQTSSRLSTETGVGERSVYRAVKKLLKIGYFMLSDDRSYTHIRGKRYVVNYDYVNKESNPPSLTKLSKSGEIDKSNCQNSQPSLTKLSKPIDKTVKNNIKKKENKNKEKDNLLNYLNLKLPKSYYGFYKDIELRVIDKKVEIDKSTIAVNIQSTIKKYFKRIGLITEFVKNFSTQKLELEQETIQKPKLKESKQQQAPTQEIKQYQNIYQKQIKAQKKADKQKNQDIRNGQLFLNFKEFIISKANNIEELETYVSYFKRLQNEMVA